MKAEYKEIQKQADRLTKRTESMLDDRNHEAAQQAIRTTRSVRESIESDKGPRTIEDMIKRAKESLEELKRLPEVMTPIDAHELAEEYEELRRECRALPNY